jgi:hypothetical protein
MRTGSGAATVLGAAGVGRQADHDGRGRTQDLRGAAPIECVSVLQLLSKITLDPSSSECGRRRDSPRAASAKQTRTERTGAVEAAAQGVRLIDHGVGSRER